MRTGRITTRYAPAEGKIRPATAKEDAVTTDNDPRLNPCAALEALAAALNPSDYRTSLVTGKGRMPYLTVTSRHASRLSEHIYANNGWYWWSWAEKFAVVDDVSAAAAKVAAVLRATAAPVHR